MLTNVTLAMRADGSMKKRYQQIEATINHNPQAVTTRCDHLVIHGFKNPLQFRTRHSKKTAVSKAIDRAIRDLTPPIIIAYLLAETTRQVKIDCRCDPLSGNQ